MYWGPRITDLGEALVVVENVPVEKIEHIGSGGAVELGLEPTGELSTKVSRQLGLLSLQGRDQMQHRKRRTANVGDGLEQLGSVAHVAVDPFFAGALDAVSGKQFGMAFDLLIGECSRHRITSGKVLIKGPGGHPDPGSQLLDGGGEVSL